MESNHKPGSRISGTSHRLLRVAGSVVLAIPGAPLAFSSQLPLPCVAGSCGLTGPASWVTSGAATGTIVGNTLTINQTTSSATLNWQNFNISADGSVVFKQPDVNSVALNRIFQADPSRIFGSLTSNGRIYLLNQNGFIFGPTASVNVGSLVASSLNITPAALQSGIAAASAVSEPAFAPFQDANGNNIQGGEVRVEAGGKLSAPNGQIMLFAPQVTNRGTISTPDGQAILAAGQRVFLLASSDPNVRGLLVEVGDDSAGPGGTVTNGESANAARSAADLVGQILAERGNVTLAGAAVNQLGRISATTSVRSNGSIRLQARDTTDPILASPSTLEAPNGGTLTFGQNSVTEVTLPSTYTEQTVDVNTQPKSIIGGVGKDIAVQKGARITSTGGSINLVAQATEDVDPLQNPVSVTSTPDNSRLFIDNGATLDVSGATVDLPMSRNTLTVELRGSELQDSPLQRKGPLRGTTVTVDLRQSGTNADGSAWQGTPLANLSADISTIQRSVQERNLAGGQINLQSQGATLVASQASLNVSGGAINWQAGYVHTTQLTGADGNVYDISKADPNRSYTGISNSQTVQDQRWGVSKTYNYPGLNALGAYQAAYVEGKDAGTVTISSPELVFNGNILGNVTVGPLQRNAPSGSALVGSMRPFNQMPVGASLVLGGADQITSVVAPDFVLSDVTIGKDPHPLVFGTGSGGTFDPLHDPLPAANSTTYVRPDLLGADGVANLSIYANGTVDVAASPPLPSGGSLTLVGGRVAINANIVASSASISALAEVNVEFTGASADLSPSVSVEPGAQLLTGGQWINDGQQLTSGRLAPLWINGGQISLATKLGGLDIGDGAVLDASGGAYRNTAGKITAGTGGSISISTTADPSGVLPPVPFHLGGKLSAYSLTTGGKLSITTNGICIGSTSCTATNVLSLSPDQLLSGGFSNISLASDLLGITVAPGTDLQLVPRNFDFDTNPSNIATGTALADVFKITTLPQYLRNPVTFSLAANGAAKSLIYSDLVLGAGSLISADPGSTLSFRSDSRVLDYGTVYAPHGTINFRLDSSSRYKAYQPDQGIWLGDTAVVDVSGTVVSTPSPLDLVTGNVLDGGTVNLSAVRGYVVTAPGSVINLSGAQAAVDILGTNGTYQRTTVASSGGSLSISTPEGALLNGSYLAHGGGPGSAGGSFALTLDPGNRSPIDFPVSDRDINITASLAPVIVQPGAQIPAQYEGQVELPAARLTDGGFDFVSATARNLINTDPTTGVVSLGGYGRVNLDAGVTLNPNARLLLDASSIQIKGAGTAQLAAAYVALGDSALGIQDAPAAVAGSGSLKVNASLIDLIGALSVSGVNQLTLNSSGDIRARGVFDTPTNQYIGALNTAAPVSITAQQIYPSTLTRYSINSDLTQASSRITVDQAGGAAGEVLSAGGNLQLNASEIDVTGTVRAPLGEVDLTAPLINVGKSGVISTSLQGATVPFGQTQGGRSYVYQLDGGVTRVYGTDGVPLPSQRVVLSGDSINLNAGSKIDVSGGGALSAYEFLPGLGGTKDVLSATVRPNQFAVVPSLGNTYAPYDPHESPGSSLKPGDQVYLYGGSGLPAGTYTLLPARYALLPGAYLVTAVSGYQDLVPGQKVAQLDGSTVVAGYRSIANTSIRGSRTVGFDVTPGTTALNEATYTLTDATTFLAAQATAKNLPVPDLPIDSGTAAFAATQQLVLNGALTATAGKGGHGAQVEVTSNIIQVDANEATPVQGVLSVSAQSLSALGAQTLVIGGTRTEGTSGEDLNASASSVTVASGAQLTAPEIILTATNQLLVKANAAITATGGAVNDTGPVNLPADAVFVRASTGGAGVVTRTGTSVAPGSLQTEAGSVISAVNGSITVDVAADAQLAGTLNIAGGTLQLGSNHIGLGSVGSGYAGLGYTPGSIPGTAPVALNLQGRQSIDLFGDFSFSGKQLSLDTPLLQSLSDSNQTNLAADSLALGSSASGTVQAGTAGGATLAISGRQIDLTGGNVALSGFASTTLSATQQLGASKSTALATPTDLNVSAGLITASSNSTLTLNAGGAVTLTGTGTSPAAKVTSLGGAINIMGASINDSATIAAPSGRIAMTASTGDLNLGAGARIDVAGQIVQFDTTNVGARGGSVVLEADAGNITATAGSDINVAAAPTIGRAGSLDIRAPNGAVTLAGTLEGSGAVRDAGGSVGINSQSFDFAQLRTDLATGGFTGSWNLEMRGPGDLNLAAGQTLSATRVDLTADQGSILIGGTIDAAARHGGQVRLAAANSIDISGKVDAHATGTDVRGGSIELDSGGSLFLRTGSALDVSGTALSDPALPPGGTIALRLPRASVDSVLDNPSGAQLSVAGTIRGYRSLTIEGVAQYQVGNGVIDSTTVLADPSNPIFADATNFTARAPQLLAALGLGSNATASVQPGIEISSPGDLTLSTDWNLESWRFNGLPGTLTLRAAGNLMINASLNDGFADTSTFALADTAPSWSYRLVAGALTSSADPLAVRTAGESTTLGGTVSIAAGTISPNRFIPSHLVMVRTGTGNIDVAAADDFSLGNQASVLYTAGVAGPGIPLPQSGQAGGLGGLAYPFDGGDIAIRVGRDILGAPSDQFDTAWQQKGGKASPLASQSVAAAWTISYGNFHQGVATLGGGSIDVSAGRNIQDLSASTVSTGRQIGGTKASQSQVIATNGGDLTVTAGGDLNGGKFTIERGVGTFIVDGQVAPGNTIAGAASVGPLFATDDGTIDVEARGLVNIASIVNPTFLPTPSNVGGNQVIFGTYAPASSASIISAGGDVTFGSDSLDATSLGISNFPPDSAFSGLPFIVLPPTLELASLSASVNLAGSITLWPAPRGNLSLLAADNVLLQTSSSNNSLQVILSDADPVLTLPSVQRPQNTSAYQTLRSVLGLTGSPLFNAQIPTHSAAGSPDGTADPNPVLLVALNGSVEMQPDGLGFGNIDSAKPVRVLAGEDVYNLSLTVQHVDPSDVSVVSAGRDVTWAVGRDSAGNIVANTAGITVAGPGELEVTAGRNVDLQASAGITTDGNLRNPALPSTGASVSVLAGLNGQTPAYDAFIGKYLDGSDTYDSLLIQYVQQVTDSAKAPTKAQALSLFKGFDRASQQPLLQQILFAALRSGGRSAAAPGPTFNNFEAAFAALTTYFPGSNPDPATKQTNPYQGNIEMFLSRIYTIAGGTINLMAPGGDIDVGIATPPLAFGLPKPADQLGIVAQSVGSVNSLSYGDFQVNQSRVFAADGGNILVWSTRGNIDAGRGAKTAISAPPPQITIDAQGQTHIVFPAALAGSGIQTLATTVGTDPGDVDLFAPHGVVNANDAGIVAGNLTIAATAVLGASNIKVSGVSVGVPVDTGGLGASLAAASSSAGSATNSGTASVGDSAKTVSKTPIAASVMGWLDVFVEGFGEEVCKASDLECLKRNAK